MRRLKQKRGSAWLGLFKPGFKSWASHIFFKNKPSFNGLRPTGWRAYASVGLVCLLLATGIGGGLFTLGGDAYADVGTVRPDGDVAGGTQFANCVTNGNGNCRFGVLDESTLIAGDYVSTGTGQGSGVVERFTMGSIAGSIAPVSQVVVHFQSNSVACNGNAPNCDTVDVNISIDGTLQTAQTVTMTTTSTLRTATFTGSWTGDDDLEILFTRNSVGGGNPNNADDDVRIYQAYAAVTYIPVSNYEQSAYRLFANANSTDVGSPLAAANTPATLGSSGADFRLRMLNEVQTNNLSQGNQKFKLQYATKGDGSCAAPSRAYADVGPDGSTWKPDHWRARNAHSSVVFNSKMWVLGGYDGSSLRNNEVWSSSDGVTWTQVTDNAGWSDRSNHTVTVFNNKIWVMGGKDGTNRFNDVWSSIDGATWTQETSGAGWSARENHQLLVHNSKMWVIGGWDAAYRNDVWSSSDGVTWTQETSGAGWVARSSHRSVVHSNKMWVFGGHDGTNYHNDVWSSSDGVTWTQETSAAGWGARNGFSAVTHNSKIWIAGGWNGTRFGDVWSSSDGITWTQETSAAQWTARNLLTLLSYDNKLWVIGGIDGDSKNDVWSSTDGITWTEKQGLAFPSVVRHRSVAFNNKLWIAGGFDGNTTRSNDVWSSPDGVIWTLETANPGWSGRQEFTMIVHDNKMWVMGGTTDGGTGRLNDVWSTSDGVTWTQVTAGANWSSRAGSVGLSHNNKLWVIGGFDGARRNDVWSSTDGATWTQETSGAAWTGRGAFFGTKHDDKMWIFSGYNGTNHPADAWYSSDGITWTQATNSPGWAGRETATVVSYNGKLWLIGGTDGSILFDDVWSSTDGVTWTEATGAAQFGQMNLHTSVVLDNKIWVLGGFDGLVRLREVWHSQGSAIDWKNNVTPVDGTALTNNANDPTHSGHTVVSQTYEEENLFTNSAAISTGQDGKWDFSLKDNGAPEGETYCFRIVKANGAALETYTVYPEVSTIPPSITQRSYIFEQDNGSTVNNNTDNGTANTALNNVKIGERLVARVQLDYTGATSVSGAQYRLYFDKNDSNFLPVKSGAEIAPTIGMSGTTGNYLAATAAGTCTSGTIFTNGIWHEQTNITRPHTLASNQCTEMAFMIDTSLASTNTTYRLQLRKGTQLLSSYVTYPTFTTVASAAGQIRSSKDTLTSMPNCTDTTWGCETIDSSVDAGNLWVSLAIDHDNNPWVSYYDATNTDLKVANYVGSGGNCTSTKWNCTRVDISAAATGSNSSIGVDPQGRVWISYRDASNDLKVAVNYDHPNMSACSASGWDCIVVENTANDLGYESSIAFDGNGNPWISYNDSTAFAIRIATFVGSGGNCTATSWNCGELDALGTASLDGDWSSIVFDDTGYAWVSYTDFTNTAMKVATTHPTAFTGASDCTLSGWKCAIVDNTGTTSGEATSIAINPATNKPWVVYEHEGNGALRYAELVGTGGSCTSSAWNCANIETGITVVPDPSLQFGPDGNAWVTFFSNFPSGTNRRLRVAKFVGSGGNCNNAAWSCSDVDTQSASTGEYAHDKAFKFDASGTGWVAYRNNSGSALKVAKTYRPHHTNPLGYKLDNTGYTATGSNNSVYDQMSGSTQLPMYRFTSVHANNTDTIAPTWVGRSTVAASTNNIRVQIYRYGSTNAWVEIATNSTCTANTACTISPSTIATNLSEYYQTQGSNHLLHFRVLQDSGTTKVLETDHFTLASLSSNTPPSSPSSLSQFKVTGGSSVPVGGWTNETQIRLSASATDPDATDTLQLCVESKAVDLPFSGTGEVCGTGVAYTGTAVTLSSTLSAIDGNDYHWQARVKDAAGAYSSWVSFGANVETARDYGIDTSAPTGTVYDGTNTGVDATFNDSSLTSLSSNWSFNANFSGLSGYEYSIGTTAGGTDIRTWTSVGTGTSVTANSLTLTTSQVYYFNVRVTDNAGNVATISSNGQMVAPTLGFSVSSSTLTFSAMNASNSYTASANTTLTVTTNARNGYQVRAAATQDLTDNQSRTIGMFSGGSWTSPAAWGSGTGLGYNSSDTSVSGSNRFNSATCPGGGSAPCFAPFSKTAPGDIVADGTAPATTGDGFTIANRVTVTPQQAAGKYTTTMRYTANAVY